MKKHILGVALAALLVVTAGYAADEFVPRRSGSSAEWGFNGSDEVRIQRMTDDGKSQVEATPDTTTAAAWASLLATADQIDWRLNTGTGHSKDISEELAAQSLQLGVMEGNGTTNVANTGTIAGDTTSLDNKLAAVADGAAGGDGVIIAGVSVTGNVDRLETDGGGILALVKQPFSPSDNAPASSIGWLRGTNNSSYILTTSPYMLDGATYDRLRGDSIGGQWMQGAVADGGAAAGKPVLMAGKDGAGTVDTIKTDTNGRLVMLKQQNSSDNRSDTYSYWMTAINNSGGLPGFRGYYYDGSNFDRVRGTAENGAWQHLKASDLFGINSLNIQGGVADGQPNTTNPVVAGLVDGGGDVQTLLGDTSGRLTIGDISGGTQTNDVLVKGNTTIGASPGGTALVVAGRDGASTAKFMYVAGTGAMVIGDVVTGADDVANNILVRGYGDSGADNDGPLVTAGMVFDGTAWDRVRGSAEFGQVVDARNTTGGARAVPNENAPDYFFDRYPDVAVAEQLLVAGQATLKPRVLEWEITVVDGDASGTLHFTDTEVTGDSSNVFGHFDSSSQGGAIRPGDDWSPLLWGTANIPIYMNVEARSNTFTTVKARLVTRQE